MRKPAGLSSGSAADAHQDLSGSAFDGVVYRRRLGANPILADRQPEKRMTRDMDRTPRSATGRVARVAFVLAILAAPAKHAEAGGSHCQAVPDASFPYRTQPGHWHLALQYGTVGAWQGYYPQLYWDNGCSGPAVPRAYYCSKPVGYYPEVARCRVRWQTIYEDPLPVAPSPSG